MRDASVLNALCQGVGIISDKQCASLANLTETDDGQAIAKFLLDPSKKLTARQYQLFERFAQTMNGKADKWLDKEKPHRIALRGCQTPLSPFLGLPPLLMSGGLSRSNIL